MLEKANALCLRVDEFQLRSQKRREESQNMTTTTDTTNTREEEEEDDANTVFESDLVFMVNDGSSSIDEALRRADRSQWIDAINNELK